MNDPQLIDRMNAMIEAVEMQRNEALTKQVHLSVAVKLALAQAAKANEKVAKLEAQVKELQGPNAPAVTDAAANGAQATTH